MVSLIREAFQFQRPASRMLARLSIDTQRHHGAIDRALLAPLAEPTCGSYRYFLARLYGFEAPLGCALQLTPGLDPAFVAERIKAGWIAADLMALGLTPAEFALLTRRHEIPSFGSAAEALGWLYVVERLALRHAAIRRRLATAIPGQLAAAGEYLSSSRQPARASWREFGALLDRWASSAPIADRIVAGAHAAFESQRAWLASTRPWDGF